MNPVIQVSAAILTHAGQVLIARRAPGDPMVGLWEFPGGKIEIDETPQQCLVRELQEELNLQVAVGEFIGVCQHQYA